MARGRLGDEPIAVQEWREVVCKQGDSLWLMAQGFLACPAALEQRAQEQKAVLDCQGKAAEEGCQTFDKLFQTNDLEFSWDALSQAASLHYFLLTLSLVFTSDIQFSSYDKMFKNWK